MITPDFMQSSMVIFQGSNLQLLKGILKNMKRFLILAILPLLTITGCGSNSNEDLVNLPPRASSSATGPASYYSFNEASGTTANNSLMDNLHGEITFASRVEGKSGNGLDFSLVDGAYVAFDICCDDSPHTMLTFPNNSFTVSTWVKPTEMENHKIYPIFGGWYGSLQSMKLRLNNGAVEFILYSNTSDPVSLITSSNVLENNKWTHIAVTYNGMQAVVYINGDEDNYSDLVMPVQDIVNDYFIGGIPSSYSAGPGAHSFPGIIDSFYLSEEPLPSDDIIKLMNFKYCISNCQILD